MFSESRQTVYRISGTQKLAGVDVSWTFPQRELLNFLVKTKLGFSSFAVLTFYGVWGFKGPGGVWGGEIY